SAHLNFRLSTPIRNCPAVFQSTFHYFNPNGFCFHNAWVNCHTNCQRVMEPTATNSWTRLFIEVVVKTDHIRKKLASLRYPPCFNSISRQQGLQSHIKPN